MSSPLSIMQWAISIWSTDRKAHMFNIDQLCILCMCDDYNNSSSVWLNAVLYRSFLSRNSKDFTSYMSVCVCWSICWFESLFKVILFSQWFYMCIYLCVCVFSVLQHGHLPVLTHLPLDKMAAILQTLFSEAFSWMKKIVFWFKIHWSL